MVKRERLRRQLGKVAGKLEALSKQADLMSRLVEAIRERIDAGADVLQVPYIMGSEEVLTTAIGLRLACESFDTLLMQAIDYGGES